MEVRKAERMSERKEGLRPKDQGLTSGRLGPLLGLWLLLWEREAVDFNTETREARMEI